MNLLAYEGKLTLGACCAKPQNRVRLATIEEVQEWLTRKLQERSYGRSQEQD